jgi:hypothetical protein
MQPANQSYHPEWKVATTYALSLWECEEPWRRLRAQMGVHHPGCAFGGFPVSRRVFPKTKQRRFGSEIQSPTPRKPWQNGILVEALNRRNLGVVLCGIVGCIGIVILWDDGVGSSEGERLLMRCG